MICPILSNGGGNPEKCQRGKCAWWSKESKACAVKVISENGGICCQPHSEYAELAALADDETDMSDRVGIEN